MLLSFQMLPEQPASELLDAAALADELGYHGCYGASISTASSGVERVRSPVCGRRTT